MDQDRLTDERLEYWRDRWREWENEEAAAICIEALELREEVERLKQELRIALDDDEEMYHAILDRTQGDL